MDFGLSPRAADLQSRVRAFVTTRSGGVSEGPYASLNLGSSGMQDDDARAVAENRRRVARHLPAPPTWLHQVHGADVVTVTAPATDPDVAADGLIVTTEDSRERRGPDAGDQDVPLHGG